MATPYPPLRRLLARRTALGLAAVLLSAALSRAQTPSPPKRHAAAVACSEAIAVDGKLDDPAWQKAPEHTGFEMPLGVNNRQPIPAEVQTSFRVVYDAATLYLGIRCAEPQLAEMTVEAAPQHDAAMWSDDDVELFFDPVGDRTEYYQLTVNSAGTQVDLYLIESGNTGKAGWSSEWQAATFRGADFWSVEIALPFGLFHNRPARTWTDNWGFSLARTRTPKPAYFSMFSPANGYHNVANFGTLGPIQVDRNAFNLVPATPAFRLEPTVGGFAVTGSLRLENRGEQAFAGTAELQILAPGAKGATVQVAVAPGAGVEVTLPGAFVNAPGKWPSLLRVRRTDGGVALNARFDTWMRYRPLTIGVTEPNYRGCIYASQVVERIRGQVALGVPADQSKGCLLRVTLSGSHAPPASTDVPVAGDLVRFELPAADLPEGDYVIRAELLRPVASGQAKPPTFECLAEAETSLRKLPPAPAVEVRVDPEGNLRVNGRPVFIRGWYGSMQYMVSVASFPAAQLPHSTNFMMGSEDAERADLNLYSLADVTRLIDEAKAKLDEPIDGVLKAKLRDVLARTRHERNVIGYYISDEPECRGLSATFLESLRDFICQEDPYRFCLIVSRSPAEYMQGCDVMCPHPYMNPMVKDGKRQFGTYLQHTRRVMTEAVAANDGSKAVWSMPQTFTYGGLYGQNPDLRESRWFTHTAIACGAKGIVPFIFNGYWNHLENRIAMDAVFAELAFLAPAWTAPESATVVSTDAADIAVIAKLYRPRPADRAHAFIVAANQSDAPAKGSFTVPALAEGKNPVLLVLRENRTVAVTDGRFTDDFEGLGVHLYTTLEALPDLTSLSALQAQIAAALRRPADEGNLLAGGKVRWCLGEWGTSFQSDSDLADGVTDAAAWLPAYSDRTQCVLTLEQPLSFSRVVLYTPTIKAADLDIWDGKEWRTIHRWADQFQHRLEWKGDRVTTDKLRVRPTAQRQGYGTWLLPEITELGLYE